MDRRMLREMRRSGTVVMRSDGTSSLTRGPLHPVDAMEDRLERMTHYASELELYLQLLGEHYGFDATIGIQDYREHCDITAADMERD